jgi:hypothetical protein
MAKLIFLFAFFIITLYAIYYNFVEKPNLLALLLITLLSGAGAYYGQNLFDS